MKLLLIVFIKDRYFLYKFIIVYSRKKAPFKLKEKATS